MPDKLLKDGLRTSARIGALPEFAELLFIRLLIATCHAGRCPWNPDWIAMHALPNRPRKRLAEIAAALETLRRAHLVTRYTGPDGTAYLLIPNHGQRLSYRVRSPWPEPPGGPPDAEGQTFMALPGSPPQAAERPKAAGARAALPFSSTSSFSETAPAKRETEAEWHHRLAGQFPGVDLDEELREARKVKGRRLERGWFETQWLPRCTERVGVVPPASVVSEPAGWRLALAQIYPENSISGDPERTWASIDTGTRQRVLAHLKQGRAA